MHWRVTGDAAFAADFFNKYINGTEWFEPWKTAAGKSGGLVLKKNEKRRQTWLGNVQFKDGMVIGSSTIIGTQLYMETGLDTDDQLNCRSENRYQPQANC